MTNDSTDYDQHAEPTMNAPEEGRPDGLEALNGDTDGPDTTQPQRSDAEVLESQEEEQPADE
ncbi:MAG TPA: hypothetical protein VFY98_08075 [Intrasporangium sp.]|nr:hypothetical protein [Intrasporangium sp.]